MKERSRLRTSERDLLKGTALISGRRLKPVMLVGMALSAVKRYFLTINTS